MPISIGEIARPVSISVGVACLPQTRLFAFTYGQSSTPQPVQPCPRSCQKTPNCAFGLLRLHRERIHWRPIFVIKAATFTTTAGEVPVCGRSLVCCLGMVAMETLPVAAKSLSPRSTAGQETLQSRPVAKALCWRRS